MRDINLPEGWEILERCCEIGIMRGNDDTSVSIFVSLVVTAEGEIAFWDIDFGQVYYEKL